MTVDEWNAIPEIPDRVKVTRPVGWCLWPVEFDEPYNPKWTNIEAVTADGWLWTTGVDPAGNRTKRRVMPVAT